MKKLVSLLTVLALVVTCCLAFTGCGQKEDAGEATSKDFKVGAIYIGSQNDKAGYTFAHHNGITKAMEELGLAKENLVVVDNVPEDKTAVANAIDTLAGKGCKIIFGTSFGYMDAMEEAAKKPEYSDIVFSHGTGYKSNDKNFNNYFGRIYQARYLAGIAAGLKSVELKNNSLGYVSAWGTDYAETCSGINAFALGAQAINPDAVVHVNVISTWGDESKEKQAAEALVSTYKCCVIAQHCDSAQPQLVASNNGIFGCGYNSDMTNQAPKAHLTAPVWNWDVYYALAIKTAMEDPANFMTKVGNYYGGLKEGFVDISALSANCSPDAKDKIEAARKLIVSGEWDVFSGIKLSFNGSEIVKTNAALTTNDGKEIVAAGGTSVEDSVITGSMNYYVAGVTEK